MKPSEGQPGSTRRTILLSLAAVVALHAAAAAGVYLATRLDPPAQPGAARDPGASAAGDLAPPAPAPAPAAGPPPSYPPPEVLAAPEVPRTEPVVPLPADPVDHADALARARDRRVAKMLREQAARQARR